MMIRSPDKTYEQLSHLQARERTNSNSDLPEPKRQRRNDHASRGLRLVSSPTTSSTDTGHKDKFGDHASTYWYHDNSPRQYHFDESLILPSPTSLDVIICTDAGKRGASRLTALPEEIRRRIFGYVVPINEKVTPTYAQGMLLQGSYGPVYRDQNVCKQLNVDAALLRVNRGLNKETSKLLYGTNRYVVSDPYVWYWWLKRIGPTNIGKLRLVALNLFPGWPKNYSNHSERCKERIWSESLVLIRYNHSLASLHITFVVWKDLNSEFSRTKVHIPPEKVQEVGAARQDVILNLRQLRGLKEVKMENFGCSYLSRGEMTTMILLMGQVRQARPLPAPKLRLAKLIDLLAHRRILKQYEEVRRRYIEQLRRPR